MLDSMLSENLSVFKLTYRITDHIVPLATGFSFLVDDFFTLFFGEMKMIG